MLPEDLKQLLLAFNAHGVEYLIVGGYAVGVYSEPRTTKDLDLFIRSDVENSEAVFQALAKFGAPLEGITPADFRDSPTSVFQIGRRQVAWISFRQLMGSRSRRHGHSAQKPLSPVWGPPVISAEHLIRNKLKSGRLRDLADVEAIREADKQAGD